MRYKKERPLLWRMIMSLDNKILNYLRASLLSRTLSAAKQQGFTVIKTLQIFRSRSVLLKKETPPLSLEI
jgi:hypothetical protein